MTNPTHVVVVANGTFQHPRRLRAVLDEADRIVAADGGANWLHAQGVVPDLLVGDMDSVRADVLAEIEHAGRPIKRHPPAKDETDTELALLEAAALDPERITVLGALGGRIDHELANVLLLTMPELEGIETVIFDGISYLSLLRHRVVLQGQVGDTLSLMPLLGDAQGIVTQGLEYPLHQETLRVGPARGVSNVLLEAEARITVEQGTLILVHTPKRYLEEDTMAEGDRSMNPFEAPEVAATYDQWFETPLGETVDRLEKDLIYRLAQPQPGETALDVGTGTGHFAIDLAQRGLEVIGYDRSEAMLEVARAKASTVTWRQGEAESLPFESDRFDLVLSITTLEFVRDPEAALAEMYRVTAPGGRVVVGVLNAHSRWAAMYRQQAEEGGTPFLHARFFTPEGFRQLLSRYGPPEWNSSVFIPPPGEGWPRQVYDVAGVLETLGQTFTRDRGALLVGRIDK